MNLWEDYPDVAPAHVPPRGRPGRGRAARASTRVRLWHDQALYKEAGGRDDRRAPGPPVLADQGDRLGHRVDPVRGVDARDGRDGLPARHPRRSACASSSTSSSASRRTSSPTPRSRGIEPVFVEVPKGSVAFHHGLTVHLAEAEHHRPRPRGAHDHLLPRRLHARLPVPALLRRPRRHRGRPADRQRRHADRLATPGRRLPEPPAQPIQIPSNVIANSGVAPKA